MSYWLSSAIFWCISCISGFIKTSCCTLPAPAAELSMSCPLRKFVSESFWSSGSTGNVSLTKFSRPESRELYADPSSVVSFSKDCPCSSPRSCSLLIGWRDGFMVFRFVNVASAPLSPCETVTWEKGILCMPWLAAGGAAGNENGCCPAADVAVANDELEMVDVGCRRRILAMLSIPGCPGINPGLP